MKFLPLAHVLSATVLVAATSSCTTDRSPSMPAPVTGDAQGMELEQVYRRLGSDGGQVFTLDPAASKVRIYVFRDGRAARLGHNHVLSAPHFKGFAQRAASDASASRFDLEFRLDELEFDLPEHRAGLGPAFASVLSAEAIAGTREHMLGESNMQADRFPVVRIHSLRVRGEAPRYAAEVAVEMHGQLRTLWIALAVSGSPDHLTVAGNFVLRQTDFGIQPYSVAGGLLAVRDEVVVDFVLEGHPVDLRPT